MKIGKIFQPLPIVVDQNTNKGRKAPSKTYNETDVQQFLSELASINIPFIKRRRIVKESYNDWKKLVGNLDSYIKPENYLGGGIEAKVYKINDKYILRLLNGTKNVGERKFNPVDDVFADKNYGQAVAISQDGKVSINKFVKGKPLYGSNWNTAQPITKEEYMKTFYEVKILPDETFSDYIKNIINIRKNGYNIDSINPNNLLLDGNRLNIIDISPEKVKPEIQFEDFFPLVNKPHIHIPISKMSQVERENFANEIKSFYDRMMRISQKEGYEFHVPALNHNELQDDITYLYYKDWNLII